MISFPVFVSIKNVQKRKKCRKMLIKSEKTSGSMGRKLSIFLAFCGGTGFDLCLSEFIYLNVELNRRRI